MFDKLNNDIENSLGVSKNFTTLEFWLPVLFYISIFCFIGFLSYALMIRVISFFEQTKPQYKISLSYDKLTYFDESYKIKLTNFFKSIRTSIKEDILNLEFKKVNKKIYINIYTDSLRLNKLVESAIKNIDGFDVVNLGQVLKEDVFSDLAKAKNTRLFIKTIFSRHSHNPFTFNESNSLEKVFLNLETIDFGGLQLTLRATNKLWFFNREVKSLRRFASSKDGGDKENLTRKANQLEEKVKEGDLFMGKIFVYSNNRDSLNSLTSAICSISKDQHFWALPVILFAKSQLSNMYLFRDSAWFRSVPRKYNYFSPLELSHFFFPNYSNQQNETDLNIAVLVDSKAEDIEKNKNIVYTLNNHSDKITFEKGKLNKLCFGSPGSGKSSSYLATEIIGGFNKDVGIISTVYKQGEADLLIHLAIKNKRQDDLVILTKNSKETTKTKWQTNIIETELRSTLSINNVLNLFSQINNSVEKRSLAGSSDPFWDRATNEYQKALISLQLLIDGKFSINRMLELTNLSIKFANCTEANDFENVDYQEFKNMLVKANQLLSLGANSELILYNKKVDSSIIHDLSQSITYFTTSFLDTAGKTRESILSVHRSVINYCNSGIIRDKLFADITPESNNWFSFSDTRKGKIIILDIPVESEGQEARNFQIIAKIAWQLEMLNNKTGKDVYYISDEFHHFISSQDTNFLSANRSYNVHNIFATQNYSQIEAVLGKVNISAFLDNIQTKLFFKTDSVETIDYAKKLIGEDIQSYSSQSLANNYTTSTNDQLRTQVMAKHFQSLSETVPENQAECILFRTESFKKNNKHYLPVIYNKIDRFEPIAITEQLPNQFEDEVKNIILMNSDLFKSEEVRVEKLEETNSLEIKQTNEVYYTKSEVLKIYDISESTLNRKQKLGLIHTEKIKQNDTDRLVNQYLKSELDNQFIIEQSLEIQSA